MMVATAMMATLMASVVVVMRSGYAVWNAQEADIDVLENGYGVLRHFVQQMRQAESVTAISAASDTTGDLSFLTAAGDDANMEPQRRAGGSVFQQRHEQPAAGKDIDTLTFTGYEADGVTQTTVLDDIQVVKCTVQVTLPQGADVTRPFPAARGFDRGESLCRTSITINNRKAQPLRDCRHRRRSGVALLLCLFVLSLVSVWVVNMFQSATVYQSALRNTIEYEQALYLANAGVHHAVAELENDLAWRGTVTAGSYPASGSYSATAVNGAAAGTVDITSTGVAGGATRRLLSTVLVN